MSNKATTYAALVDGLLALAARDLSAQEYAELRGGLSSRGWNSDECPSPTRENPCTFPRWHHGPHSWEKATDADALVERYRSAHPEGVGRVTIGEALAAMQKQNANPPACGFRSLREDAHGTPDAKVRTGPMCKATKGTGTGHDICWRADGHREDHDFRPGVVATGAGSGGGLATMSDWELAQKISTSRYVMEKVAPPAHVEGCCILSPHEVPTMCMTGPRMGGSR